MVEGELSGAPLPPYRRQERLSLVVNAQVAPEPRALVEPLEGPVVGEDLLEEVVAATGAEGAVELDEASLLEERPRRYACLLYTSPSPRDRS